MAWWSAPLPPGVAAAIAHSRRRGCCDRRSSHTARKKSGEPEIGAYAAHSAGGTVVHRARGRGQHGELSRVVEQRADGGVHDRLAARAPIGGLLVERENRIVARSPLMRRDQVVHVNLSSNMAGDLAACQLGHVGRAIARETTRFPGGTRYAEVETLIDAHSLDASYDDRPHAVRG